MTASAGSSAPCASVSNRLFGYPVMSFAPTRSPAATGAVSRKPLDQDEGALLAPETAGSERSLSHGLGERIMTALEVLFAIAISASLLVACMR